MPLQYPDIRIPVIAFWEKSIAYYPISLRCLLGILPLSAQIPRYSSQYLELSYNVFEELTRI